MENIGFRQWAPAVVWRLGSFLGSLGLTFLGLTAVTFLISRLTRIDPVLAIVGDKATKEVYDKTFIALGLDQPLIVQYGVYLKRLLSGDFGVSVLTSQPVLSDLIRVFPATFELATIATLIGVLIGVPSAPPGPARGCPPGWPATSTSQRAPGPLRRWRSPAASYAVRS